MKTLSQLIVENNIDDKNLLYKVESWFDNDIKKYYEEIDKKKNFDLILYLKDSLAPIGNLLLDRVI